MSLFLDFIFPRICHHCGEEIEGKGRIFCAGCAQQIELIAIGGRCRICFEEKREKRCLHCLKYPSSFHAQGALFEPIGVNQSFLKLCSKERSSLVDELLASYIVIQLKRLNWQLPTLILYQNPGKLSRILQGVAQDRQVAMKLAQMLGAQTQPSHKEVEDINRHIVLALNPPRDLCLFPKKLYGLWLSSW